MLFRRVGLRDIGGDSEMGRSEGHLKLFREGRRSEGHRMVGGESEVNPRSRLVMGRVDGALPRTPPPQWKSYERHH